MQTRTRGPRASRNTAARSGGSHPRANGTTGRCPSAQLSAFPCPLGWERTSGGLTWAITYLTHPVGVAHDTARYGYRKADRAYPGPDAVHEEIAAARRIVQGGGETTGD